MVKREKKISESAKADIPAEPQKESRIVPTGAVKMGDVIGEVKKPRGMSLR